MKDLLAKLRLEGLSDIANSQTSKELEDIRVRLLGKKGELTNVLRGMKDLGSEERPLVGQIANEVRDVLEDTLGAKQEELRHKEVAIKLEGERIDITLPGEKPRRGTLHPLSKVLSEIEEIFLGLGFSIAEGPEIENLYYSFDALNIPKDHPARDLQDTFYVNDELILRTQTSSVQIREMEKRTPPIRMISPGRVFRLDEVDATHSPMFHQIEGLVIDKGITMAQLKWTLDMFAKQMFGASTKTIFRPHHFQFTEPSAEMDVTCVVCGGSGCRVCKNTGYIEILGCGMVHPNVLRAGGIDPEIYSGFAFGMGLDRITTIKYGIDDLRLLFENDVRFLGQF